MEIKLSDHFTYKKLIRFVIPSIVMMIFTSIYGVVSALISFLRTLLFQVSALFLLPLIWGVDGIFAAIIAAEIMALLLTIVFLIAKRKKYGYF